jgi:flagellar basal-body rod protein FlgB
MDALFDKGVDVLSRSMDLYLLRHSVIADNIANAETPAFKARRVDFEKELQGALDEGVTGFPERNVASIQPVISEDPEAEVGQDLNSVDMDREMAALTKNDVKYSAATQAISRKFALLKYAISEGGQ